MMRYSEWFEWLAQKWEIELRNSIVALRGRSGHARAMAILHAHAAEQGREFRVLLMAVAS